VSWLTIVLLVLSGIAAGFVNAVAGGGSVFIMPVLIHAFGGSIANGTLRLGTLLGDVIGAGAYARGGVMPWRRVLPLVPPTIAGAAAGAWLATEVSPETMRRVLAVAVLLVALSVLLKPSGWVRAGEPRLKQPWLSLVFVAAGFYGGFVQVGIGFVLLAPLVLGGGLGLVRGNAAKSLLVVAYQPFALLIFWRASQVNWTAGLILAAGVIAGELVAVRLALKKGSDWIRWVLAGAAVAAAVYMLVR
jgi:uncharacterized membrane protein YfcA